MKNAFQALLQAPRTVLVSTTMAVTFLAVLVSSGLTGCGRPSSHEGPASAANPSSPPAVATASGAANTGGSGDAGGGTTTNSTDEDVKEAIAWALKNMTEAPDNEMPILSGIFAYNFEVDNRYVLTVITNPQSYFDFTKVKYDHPGQYLKLSKVYFKQDGPCPSSNHDEAAASVSKMAYGADICFSVSELKKIPHAALHAEIFALWVHELAHLSGYGEDIAVKVQHIILDHWAELSGTDGQFEKNGLIYGMDNIIAGLQLLIKDPPKNSKPALNEIIKLSEIKGQLIEISMRIPSRIYITLPIAHPELEETVRAKMDPLFESIDRVVKKLKKGISRKAFSKELTVLIQQIDEQKLLMENYFEGRHFDTEDPIQNPA